MKADRIIARCIIILVMLICIISCQDQGQPKPYWTDYHIYTDSITVQDQILQTEVLDITFYFCLTMYTERFDRFETRMDSNTLSVKLIGQVEHNVPVVGAFEYKEKVLPIIGFPADTCYIRVLQPVGDDIFDSVLVLR